MSRVIIKNLPKSGMKEEQLKTVFGEYGNITDCSLKYTRDGVFRQFAFIGYENEQQATEAINKLNMSFIGTNRINVELAADFGAINKPRAWSKYSKDSSAGQQIAEESEEVNEESKKKIKEKEKKNSKKEKAREDKLSEMLGDLKDDPEFKEFVEVHKNRKAKATWKDMTLVENELATPVKPKDDGDDNDDTDDDKNDNSSSSGDDNSADVDKRKTTSKGKASSKKNKKNVSDLEFLKSKMSKSHHVSDSEGSEEESENEEEKDETSEEDKMDVDEDKNEGNSKDSQSKGGRFVIKMKGLPPNVKRIQIAEFFKPFNPIEIKVPCSAKGNKTFSFATVEFSSDKDTDAAMEKNKNFIGPKKIHLYKVKRESKSTEEVEKGRTWENKIKESVKTGDAEDESIAESGRIFVRNLAYICKETDLEALFGKYGPLTEVNLPVDNMTKKVKGFAFVTFMIPEHAVKAYTELDGTVFQGRMLHILTGKAKKDEEDLPESALYKKKKESQMRKLASSSHNWNTLFVGANSVVDVMAETYGTTKDKILDVRGKQSLGVRVALGETQVVAEIREFLVENGVVLNSFSQAAAERSKTVILVKNLPAGTQAQEIQDLFSRHGTLGRVLLPPAGVTAIVEFVEPSEARNGFRNLAYTKFQHMPLYLEWAPMSVFTNSPESTKKDDEREKEAKESTKEKSENSQPQEKEIEDEEVEEEEEEGESNNGDPQTTLFVKNLNFNTTDDTLQKKFSKCGRIKAVSVAKKKDLKNPGKILSMGYGFVEYKKKESAEKALKELQHCILDGHQLELKLSNRATIKKPVVGKKKQEIKKQTSSKILVRNIPFEAKPTELHELFGTFGELKTVRMPKKVSGTGSHRGFGFVDFLTKQDAQRAFKALCHDTHLYGRRLVLEWANNEESVEQLREKTAQHFHDGGPSKKLRKTALIEDLHMSNAS